MRPAHEVRKPRDARSRCAIVGSWTSTPHACYRALQTREPVSTGASSRGSRRPASIAGRSARPGRPSARMSASIPPRPPRRRRGSGPACAAGRRPRRTSPPGAAPRNTVSRALALIEAGALDEGRRRGPGRPARASASGSCAACSGSISAPRRWPWRRPGGCCSPSSSSTRPALPMAEVALAAGFGSVRRFNETFQQLFGRPPGDPAPRRARAAAAGAAGHLPLPYRPPYDWDAMLGVPGGPRHPRRREPWPTGATAAPSPSTAGGGIGRRRAPARSDTPCTSTSASRT